MAEIYHHTEICPHIKTCDIYKNWVEQTKDKRLDIIGKDAYNYRCLAKISLEDPSAEGGIMPNKEIKDRLQNLSSPCSHITLLTLLNLLTKKND